jgi:hypothetical protein
MAIARPGRAVRRVTAGIPGADSNHPGSRVSWTLATNRGHPATGSCGRPVRRRGGADDGIVTARRCPFRRVPRALL